MRKIISLILCVIFVFSAFSTMAAGTWEKLFVEVNGVFVTVDGAEISCRNFVHEGTTYLALRDTGNALGYAVEWDGETNTAILTKGEASEVSGKWAATEQKEISVLVNDVNVVIDGNKVDARNFVYEDTTYLALRDIGNATGFDVYWDEPTFTAVLTAPGKDRILPEEKIEKEVAEIRATAGGVEVSRIFLQNVYVSGRESYWGKDFYNYLNDQVLNYAYVISESEKYNLTLTKEETEEIETTVSTYIENLGGKDAIANLLTENNFTYDEFVADMKAYLEAGVLSGKLYNYIYENSDSLREFKANAKIEYENNLKEYYRPTTVTKHILILKETENAEKIANDILAKLKKGADFETLLKENNNDPGQTEEGYLVYESSGFVDEFEQAALKLKKGEISPVVKTEYGYHILKAIDTHEYVPFEEAFVKTYTNDINKIYQEIFDKWAENVTIESNWKN